MSEALLALPCYISIKEFQKEVLFNKYHYIDTEHSGRLFDKAEYGKRAPVCNTTVLILYETDTRSSDLANKARRDNRSLAAPR